MKFLIGILDKIPTQSLVVMAIFLGIAPFRPPHLVEKFHMLMAGELTKWIDIGDVAFHLAPTGILVLKLIRLNKLRNAE